MKKLGNSILENIQGGITCADMGELLYQMANFGTPQQQAQVSWIQNSGISWQCTLSDGSVGYFTF